MWLWLCVLLYYFDLVIRSAGSQNIFFGGGKWIYTIDLYICIDVCVCVSDGWRCGSDECVSGVILCMWIIICECFTFFFHLYVRVSMARGPLDVIFFMCFSYLLPMTHRDNNTCFSLTLSICHFWHSGGHISTVIIEIDLFEIFRQFELRQRETWWSYIFFPFVRFSLYIRIIWQHIFLSRSLKLSSYKYTHTRTHSMFRQWALAFCWMPSKLKAPLALAPIIATLTTIITTTTTMN